MGTFSSIAHKIFCSFAHFLIRLIGAIKLKVSPEQCGEAALLISSLAFHIQRSYNREVARINWADRVLKSTIAGKEQSYRGSWESQFNQAIKEDGYTTKIADIKRYAQQRADRLTYLSSSMKNMSDVFLNVQRSKALKHE